MDVLHIVAPAVVLTLIYCLKRRRGVVEQNSQQSAGAQVNTTVTTRTLNAVGHYGHTDVK
jgi:hypothetical protein